MPRDRKPGGGEVGRKVGLGGEGMGRDEMGSAAAAGWLVGGARDAWRDGGGVGRGLRSQTPSSVLPVRWCQRQPRTGANVR